MSNLPSANGPNGGRDANGRFAPGNKGGPGNPEAARVARIRSALLRAANLKDVRAIIKSLIEQAKGGDVAAAKLLFDRILGRPIELDILERLEALERNMNR